MCLTSSPYFSSGTSKQIASTMSGCERRTSSTSIGDIFSPENMGERLQLLEML